MLSYVLVGIGALLVGAIITAVVVVTIGRRKKDDVDDDETKLQQEQYLQEAKQKASAEVSAYRQSLMENAEAESRAYKSHLDSVNADYKQKADETIAAYQANVVARQQTLDKEIEMRKGQLAALDESIKKDKERVDEVMATYKASRQQAVDKEIKVREARLAALDEAIKKDKKRADEAVETYKASVVSRQQALDKEIEMRKSRIATLDDTIKKDEERIKTLLNNHKEKLDRQLKELEESYGVRSREVNEAIAVIEGRLKEWSKAERIAYDERVQRDETMNHNRLILSKRGTEELQELYSAISKLKVANPLPLYKAVYEMYLRGPVKELGVRLNVCGVCGIYKITNTVNGKVYVGQSVDLAERWKQHIKRGTNCEVGTASGAGLYDAMFEDGVWNFSFELLEECEKESLNEREKFWIQYFNATDVGYNKKI